MQQAREVCMPNINEIMQVAEALEKSPVAVLRDRCVAVRNRNATCRKCVDICQVDAIDIAANEIHLDAGACMACGACTTVCPTEALAPVQPTDDALAEAVANSAAKRDSRALIACARISSKRLADPGLYAEVPCMARVDESILLDLAAHGVTEIELIDGTCATCKYRACVPAIDATVLYANELLAAQGSALRVQRASEFPSDTLVDSAEGLFGSTRRGFFSEAAGAAKETAMVAAKTTIEQELGYTAPEVSIGERLRVTQDGAMPRLEMPRHDRTINAMDAIGLPVVDSIDTRRFGSVQIDLQKCNACGMCAVFCSTGALKRDDGGSVTSELKCLEFSASECVQCGLCRDVCWKGALTLSSTVSTEQIFDFEPVVFDLKNAQRQNKNPFGKY